jgi:hypothetical protein
MIAAMEEISALFRIFIVRQNGQAIHVVERHRLERELKVLWRQTLEATGVKQQDLPKELICWRCACPVGESENCSHNKFCHCHP